MWGYRRYYYLGSEGDGVGGNKWRYARSHLVANTAESPDVAFVILAR